MRSAARRSLPSPASCARWPPRQGETEWRSKPATSALEEGPSKGRYVFELDGHTAFLTFSKAGERLIIIDHTEVPSAFRGQGVGVALVARAVEDARASGKKITPLCPFAAAQFRRHPEWADVLRGAPKETTA